MTYPASEIYHFEPLDERVEVFEQPFQLVQEVTIPMTREIAGMAAQPDATLTIEGYWSIRRATPPSATRRSNCR